MHAVTEAQSCEEAKLEAVLQLLERGKPARRRFEVFVYTNIELVRHPQVRHDSIRLFAFMDRRDMRLDIYFFAEVLTRVGVLGHCKKDWRSVRKAVVAGVREKYIQILASFPYLNPIWECG